MKIGSQLIVAGLLAASSTSQGLASPFDGTTRVNIALTLLSITQTASAIDLCILHPMNHRRSVSIPRKNGDDGEDNEADEATGFTNPFFGGGSQGGSSGGSTLGPGGFANGFDFSDIEEWITYRNAHGIIMAVVVVLLFPIGGLVMRLLGIWWVHAAWQMLSVLALIAGFGIGVYLAHETNLLFNNSHTILGTVVTALFLIAQPVLGFLQHAYFIRNQKRGPSGHMHAWLGRILIVLGIVAGGLGLKLARTYGRQDGSPTKIYIIVSTIMGALYLIIWGITAVMKRLRSRKGKSKGVLEEPKRTSRHGSTSMDEAPPNVAGGRT